MENLNIPQHVAIILDGNGRWAKKRHLPRNMGHRQGSKVVEKIIEDAHDLGTVSYTHLRTSESMERTKADQIGMLATVMNCIYVSDAFRTAGMETEVYTPFVCGAFTELFSKDKAVKALDEGKVVFFAGGTGHPYFSTDTATALRAIEIEADAILLAKSIDGVYDSDPAVNENAVKYDSITIDVYKRQV